MGFASCLVVITKVGVAYCHLRVEGKVTEQDLARWAGPILALPHWGPWAVLLGEEQFQHHQQGAAELALREAETHRLHVAATASLPPPTVAWRSRMVTRS